MPRPRRPAPPVPMLAAAVVLALAWPAFGEGTAGRARSIGSSSWKLPLPGGEAQPEPPGGPPFDPDQVHPGCPEGSRRQVRWTGRGIPSWTVSCKDAAGKLVGPFVQLWPDGSPLTRGTYRDGKREGWFSTWEKDGILSSEYEWRDGKQVARHRVGAEASHVRAATPADPVYPCPAGAVVGGAAPPKGREQWCERDRGDGAYVLDGPRLTWWSRSPGPPIRREEYHDGIPDGTWIEWENGKKKYERHYTAGKLDGMARTWHPNGRKACNTRFENGARRGEKCWDEEGHPRSEVLRDAEGVMVHRTFFYPNGQKRREESWQDGKRTGMQREWWANGRLRSEGREREATAVGTWRYWTPEGVLARVVHHGRDAESEKETFAAYHYDGPDWVPAPPPRGATRAPSGPPECPEGTRLASHRVGSDADQLLPSLVFSGKGEEADDVRVLLGFLPTPAGQVQVCERHGVRDGSMVWTRGESWPVEGRYAKGEPAGTWTFWDREGHEAGEVVYRDGRKAMAVEWYPDGRAKSLQHFDREGREDGLSVTWYPNGALRLASHYRHGKFDGVWLYHKETGFRYQRAEYRDGRKDGVWIKWQEGIGQVSEETWRAGVRNGRSATYEPGGSLRVERNYRDGKLDGPYREYHPNGQLAARGRYERGRRVGPWVVYYANGNKSEEGTYVWCQHPPRRSVAHVGRSVLIRSAGEGCKQGPWTYWSRNGKRIGTAQHTEAEGAHATPAAPPRP